MSQNVFIPSIPASDLILLGKDLSSKIPPNTIVKVDMDDSRIIVRDQQDDLISWIPRPAAIAG